MPASPKSKTPPPPRQAAAPQRAPNPRTTADQRWQRTVRFVWDKGGSKGGRR